MFFKEGRRQDNFTVEDAFLLADLAADTGEALVWALLKSGTDLHPKLALPAILELMGAVVEEGIRSADADEDPSSETMKARRAEIIAKYLGAEVSDAAEAQAQQESD